MYAFSFLFPFYSQQISAWKGSQVSSEEFFPTDFGAFALSVFSDICLISPTIYFIVLNL